jgi:hypothetical protein
VDENQKEEFHDEGTCVVHVSENRFEADVIRQALEAERIPYVVREHEETAYDGIFVPQRGWGAFLVPFSHRNRAEEVIQNILETYTMGPGESL